MSFTRLHNRALFVLVLLLAVSSPLSEIKGAEPGSAAENALAEAQKLRSEQNAAANYKAVEKYREAAKLFLTAAHLKPATTSLRNAGEILHLLGNTSAAKSCFEQALALTKKTGDLLERARIFNDLAYLYFVAGNNKDAQRNSLVALKLGKQLRNREIEAEALSNLGEALYGLGELDIAREHQQRSLAIWRELDNQRGQAVALIALGYYFQNAGQPENAVRSYAEALSMAQQARDLGVETQALIVMGNIERKLGNNQKAFELYESAKKVAERIGDQTAQASILGGIGSIHFAMGDKRQALQYMAEGTNLMERNDKKWGTAEGKLELGKIHHSLNEQEPALQYLNEALVLFQEINMPRMQSATLRALGLVYNALGETGKALQSLKEALRLTKSGQDQRDEAYTRNYLGRVYQQLKQIDQALLHYRRALQQNRVSSDPQGEALTRYNLAHLERDRGNFEEARRQIEAALAIVESQRTNVSSQDLRTSYFATVRNTYDLYIDILMLLHKQNPQLQLDADAFAGSEKARARTFLEQLLEANSDIRQGVDPTLLSKERELNEALNTKAQLHVQLLTAKQAEAAARINKELDSLVVELAKVRDQIKQNSPNRNSLALPQLLTLKDTQQRLLDHDTVVLEFVLGDDRSYVWVITKTAYDSFELPSRSEIEASSQRLYKLITSAQFIYGEPASARVERQAKADAQIPHEAALLSKLVLGPLTGKLDKKRLVIVADGALQYIPFQLLSHPDAQTTLIDRHEIVYSPSVSTLAVLQAESAARKRGINSVAVLADPVFEADDPRVKSGSGNKVVTTTTEVHQALRDVGISPDGVQIPRLHASGAEANEIIGFAPWRTGLKAVGFAANRERVMGSELGSYRIVHFATHGIVNSERPELSGIVLSLFDSEGRSQNGFLRLHDIYNLKLPADLVVLSACSTALGKDVRGEGLIGLTRGFMYAGASGVIASLWKVDDDATAELMKHFYEAMFKKGLSPAAALREAQLALSRQKRWQSPYYWAGFVIQGQYTGHEKFTQPFPNRNQIALAGTIGGLLLLASIFVIRRRRQ